MFDPPFNYNMTAHGYYPDVHAGMLHDAMLLYAYALNKTLEEGGSEFDGIAIAKNMLNSSFQGVTGFITIDALGNRNPDLSLRILQGEKFVVMGDYFAYNSSYVPRPAVSVTYMGGRKEPPIGYPLCGWENEHCPDTSQTIMISVVTSICILVLLFIIISVFIQRKLRFESELKQINLWKVEYSDVRLTSRGELSRISLRESMNSKILSNYSGQAQLFTTIGHYKSNLVALKFLDKKEVIAIDRSLLLEFKEMRDITHENLNRFIGACVDRPHVCILMMYCMRGSLQDVLENDKFKLTWDFKISIATDICKGMQYLHSSVIGSHGRLKSSNCVVDSRWVCKVTDYGLGNFKSGCNSKFVCEVESMFDMLWTAPELLRKEEPPLYGTKEGDVFSYGIILQEITLSSHPYSCNNPELEPPEIIKLVSNVFHCDKLHKNAVRSHPHSCNNPEMDPTEIIKMISGVSYGLKLQEITVSSHPFTVTILN